MLVALLHLPCWHTPPGSCLLLKKRDFQTDGQQREIFAEQFICKLPVIPKAIEQPGKYSPNPTIESRRTAPWWRAYLTRGAIAPGYHLSSSLCWHSEAGHCWTRRRAGDHLHQSDICHHLMQESKKASLGEFTGATLSFPYLHIPWWPKLPKGWLQNHLIARLVE